MSTYSWSYKTASHRQPAVKKVTAAGNDVETPESTTKQSVVITNDETEKPRKRFNWKAKIYVGNLNKKTTEASLAYYFSVFGDIDDVKLIRDHDTNESRGFAFVTFEKIESAEKAKKWCSYNYPSLDDNNITVASAERKVPKPKPQALNEYAALRDPSQTLYWEYKWCNEPDAEVYGPYETNLMLAWKNQGYFDGGCWVRQVHRHDRRVEDREVKDKIEVDDMPRKKLKLVIDYSDSDDEEVDEKDNRMEQTEGMGPQADESARGVNYEQEARERKQEGGEDECSSHLAVVSDEKQKTEGQEEEQQVSTRGDQSRTTENMVDNIIAKTADERKSQIENDVANEEGDREEKENTEERKQRIDAGTGETKNRNYEGTNETNEGKDSRENENMRTELKNKNVNVRSNKGNEIVNNDSDNDDEIDNTDDLSTEFVAISEIDFSFFP